MATIVLRSANGAPLTNAQVDGNFTNLNNDILTRAVLNQAPASQANILPNSSAEFGNFMWNGNAGYSVGLYGDVTLWVMPSTSSALSFAQTSNYIGYLGGALWLQAEIFNMGMTSGTVFAQINFYDSTQTLISSGTPLTVANGSNWTWVYGLFVPPANTNYVTVSFGYTNAITSNTLIRRIKLSQSLSYYSNEASQYYAQFGNPNNTFQVANASASNHAVALNQLQSATAPSQLLTSIKTVDGAGSGLDADLLGGLNSSVSNNINTVVVRDSTGAIYTSTATTSSHAVTLGQITSIAGYTYTSTNTSKTIINRERVSVTAATQTITLPASPSNGFECWIGVDNFTDTQIAPNGQTINNISDNFIINQAYATVGLYFNNGSWRVF